MLAPPCKDLVRIPSVIWCSHAADQNFANADFYVPSIIVTDDSAFFFFIMNCILYVCKYLLINIVLCCRQYHIWYFDFFVLSKNYPIFCWILLEIEWVYFSGWCSQSPWRIWMAKSARFVGIPLALQLLVMSLLLAMSVLSQFVDLVMSMSAKMETSLVLSVKLDIRDRKVSIYSYIFFWIPFLYGL